MKDKRSNIKGVSKLMICASLVAATLFSGCEDWTEIEPIETEQQSIAESDAAIYVKYLQNLRSYKQSNHKCMYATFNNEAVVPFSKAQHLTNLPDSLDIVGLQNPDKLPQWQLDEINLVRKDKGTKFVFTVDFDRLKLEYDDLLAANKEAIEETPEGEEPPASLEPFISFLIKKLNGSIDLVRQFNYDGICFAFKGKSVRYMTETELNLYTSYHNCFIGILKDWLARNEGKLLLFQGNPKYLIDKTFLQSCKYIILPCHSIGAAPGLTQKVKTILADGVPNDKFIISVETASLDPSDVQMGYWSDGSTRAITGAAMWVAANHDGFVIAGLGIMNVSNDYYGNKFSYLYTRSAISYCNPSLKN